MRTYRAKVVNMKARPTDDGLTYTVEVLARNRRQAEKRIERLCAPGCILVSLQAVRQ